MRLHKRITWPRIISRIGCAVSLLGGANGSFAGAFHAKAINVLTTSVPLQVGSDRIVNVELQVTFDGGVTFNTLGLGKPRSLNLFRNVHYGKGRAEVSVAFAGDLQNHTGQFFTDVAGEFWFRWRFWINDINADPIEIDQVARFAASSLSDSLFLTRLGEEPMTKRLFGDGFFDSRNDESKARWIGPGNNDMRALMVVGEFLKATRAKEPGDVLGPRAKGIDDFARWADTLLPLAKEIPDSSYAPYAAFFAGCCYMTCMGQEAKEKYGELTSAKSKENPNYQKSDEALTLAIERGDAYLKPRALYMKAFLRSLTADWDEADQALDAALLESPGTGTIQEMVDEIRPQIRKERDRSAQKVQKDSTP